MRFRVLISILLGALCAPLGACGQGTPSPSSLQKAYEQAMEKIESEYRDSVGRTRKGYLGALRKYGAAMQKKGELDAILRTKEEMTWLNQDDPKAAPAEDTTSYIAENRASYLKSVDRADTERKSKTVKLMEQYLRRLSPMVKKLVREEKIEEAVAVRSEAQRIKEAHAALKEALAAKRPATQEPELKPEKPKEIDLIPLVNVALHRRMGGWQIKDGKVACGAEGPQMLILPYYPPEEYDLEVTFKHVYGEHEPEFTLLYRHRAVRMKMDSFPLDGSFSGFSNVDELIVRHPDNPTRKQGKFVNREGQNTFICRARKTGIEVLLNGEQLVNYTGEAMRLTNREMPLPPDGVLTIGSRRAGFEFSKIVLRPVSGSGKPMKFATGKYAGEAPHRIVLGRGDRPTSADGRPLNLGFEDGTLKDWKERGKAFDDQPVRGEINQKERRLGEGKFARHEGEYWIGGFEFAHHDREKGTLTSVPFKVTHPYASFRVGGGGGSKVRVELILEKERKPFFQATGTHREAMRAVIVDLTKQMGRSMFIRVVDDADVGWGHINFDDFRFHETKPVLQRR